MTQPLIFGSQEAQIILSAQKPIKKSCPFCAETKDFTLDTKDERPRKARVKCKKCGAHGPWGTETPGEQFIDYWRLAATAWDERPEQ